MHDNELLRMWDEALVAYFNALSRHLFGGTVENSDKCPSGQSVSRHRLESATS
jgi:hypothetical protein